MTTRAAKPGKLALLGAFVLQPGLWDEQAEAWSHLIPHDWPGEFTNCLGEMVKSGKAQMTQLLRDGQRIAYVIHKTDRETYPLDELVILAAYSSEGRIDVTSLCVPDLEAMAVANGCATVRCGTMRAALIQKLLSHGWQVCEVIVRKDVRHE